MSPGSISMFEPLKRSKLAAHMHYPDKIKFGPEVVVVAMCFPHTVQRDTYCLKFDPKLVKQRFEVPAESQDR